MPGHLKRIITTNDEILQKVEAELFYGEKILSSIPLGKYKLEKVRINPGCKSRVNPGDKGVIELGLPIERGDPVIIRRTRNDSRTGEQISAKQQITTKVREIFLTEDGQWGFMTETSEYKAKRV